MKIKWKRTVIALSVIGLINVASPTFAETSISVPSSPIIVSSLTKAHYNSERIGRARRGGDRGAVRAVRLLGRGVGSERPQPRADADRNSGVSAAVTRRVCRTGGLAHFDP